MFVAGGVSHRSKCLFDLSLPTEASPEGATAADCLSVAPAGLLMSGSDCPGAHAPG